VLAGIIRKNIYYFLDRLVWRLVQEEFLSHEPFRNSLLWKTTMKSSCSVSLYRVSI